MRESPNKKRPDSHKVDDMSNPISIIHSRLQEIRSSREQAQSDVEALEREKRAIQATLPKVLYELNQMRESLENKERELAVLDKAIDEIESTYGHMLFSAEFFANSANNTKS